MMILASYLTGGALLLVLLLLASMPWTCQRRYIDREASQGVSTTSRRVSEREIV